MLNVSNARAESQASTPVVLTAIVVAGLFLLLALYVGLARHYNAQELQTLIQGAEASGQGYSVVIHNSLTGNYSFNVE